jgi:hypothetical protein
MFPSSQSQGQSFGRAQSQGRRPRQPGQGGSPYQGLRPSSGGGFGQAQQGSFGSASSGSQKQAGGAWGQGAPQEQSSFGAATGAQQPASWSKGAQAAPKRQGQQSSFGAASGQASHPSWSQGSTNNAQTAQAGAPVHPWARTAQQQPQASQAGGGSWMTAAPAQPNTIQGEEQPHGGGRFSSMYQGGGGDTNAQNTLQAGAWQPNDIQGQARADVGGGGLVQQPGQIYNFNTGQMETATIQEPSWRQGAVNGSARQQAYNFNTGQLEDAWESPAPSWSVAEQLEDPLDPYGLRRRQMSRYASFQQ